MSDLILCGGLTAAPHPTKSDFRKGGSIQAGDVGVRSADGSSDRGWRSEQRPAWPEGRGELPRVPRVVVDDRALAGGRRSLPERLRRAVEADAPEGRGKIGTEMGSRGGAYVCYGTASALDWLLNPHFGRLLRLPRNGVAALVV